MAGYPRPLSDWGMRRKNGQLVDRVDAAFIWAHNGKTYLFSEGEYWRFDESRKSDQVTRQPDLDYPRENKLWEGIPLHMDDIISWGEGDAYFFKDNSYWVFMKGRLTQDAVTPKSIGEDWLRCPAPPSTANPRFPKECSCDIKGSSPPLRSSWILLISVILITRAFIRVCNSCED